MKNTKKYGVAPEEVDILDAIKCREIIHEILNFGVNQHQMITLIRLLALELENRDLMLEIINLIDNCNEQQFNEPTITV